MAYFIGKGTAGIQDPNIRQSILSGLSSGQNLFGGQAKSTAVTPASPGATPGINQANMPPEGCQNGDPKRKGVPCAVGQVIRLDADGREWCCDKAAISGDCETDAHCGPNEKCISRATGDPCNGTCTDGQCVGGGQGADCRSCGPEGDCVDGVCVGGSNAGKICVTCQDGYYCGADGKCKKVGGGGAGCQTNDDCGPGQRCLDGQCVAELPPGSECASNSECKCPEGQVALCQGGKCSCKGLGQKEVTTECTTDKDCPPGTHCGVAGAGASGGLGAIGAGQVPGKKYCIPDAQACPEGVGSKEYKGCACGREYTTMTGNCPEGYVHVPRSGTGWHGWKKGAVGRCECVKYCEENGYGSDCQGGGTIGEYTPPENMDALMRLMMARANALMQMPGGYSQSEINKMFGKGFEGIKGREASKRNQTEEYLSREGQLGTGTATGAMGAVAREGETDIANLMRDIFLANMGQKRQDLKDYTGLAGGIMGQGMNYETLIESINAARRGEKNNALMLLLQLLGLYKG